MDPISAIAMVGTCAAIINQVIIQIRALCELYQAVKGADVHLMSLIAQLNTMKAALGQIQVLMEKGDYDEQLQMDLDLALKACTLLMRLLEDKIAKMKVKKGATTLKLKSKIKVVFDSKTMAECLTRLDHQAGALTLLITVLTSKTVTEQKTLLLRSNTRKVFKQLQDDSASIRDLQGVDAMAEGSLAAEDRKVESKRPAPTRTKTDNVISLNPWKRFGFDRQLLASKAYDKKRKPNEITRNVTNETSCTTAEEDDGDEDLETLVDEPQGHRPIQGYKAPDDATTMPQTPQLYNSTHPQHSKMLAFSHEQTYFPDLISHVRGLWQAPNERPDPSSRATIYSLKTSHFDLSIRHHSINPDSKISEDFLASVQDSSNILFVVQVANYCRGGAQDDDSWLVSDVQLFDLIVNDYHLWLARVMLFLDTTGLEQALQRDHWAGCGCLGSSVDAMVESVRSRFMRAAHMGTSFDRIHVHVGEVDEVAACAIFAVTAPASQAQSNKWSGLTRHVTT